MNNTESLFNELGISPLLATKIMYDFDLLPEHLSDPIVFSKLQSIVDFLKQYPEDTQRFLIKKATLNKQDKLKVMHEYTKLLSDRLLHEKIAKELEKEKSVIGFTNDMNKIKEIFDKETQNNNKLQFLREEIELYHK